MTAPESRRHELYNGLTDILGAQLTDTLMAYLPTAPAVALATKDDIGGLWTAIRQLDEEIRLLTQRFDRLQLTLIAGFMSMIVALLVVGFFG